MRVTLTLFCAACLRTIFLLILMCLVGPARSHAGTFTAFGPQDFTRQPGAPTEETVSFAVLNPDIVYTLRIENGGASGAFERVSSAVITLNGEIIVKTNEFNQNVALIEKPVTLATTNTLGVELRSKSGSGLTIKITGEDNDLPTITAVVDPAANAAGWHKTDVIVSFLCSDSTSGLASCSPPITLSQEGMSQASGLATDFAGNTATTHVTVNIDKTPPDLAITSLPENVTLNTSEVTVTGEVEDLLSGIDFVTCNAAAASLSETTFTCPVSLDDGENTLEILATDVAGNTSAAIHTVTVVPVVGVAITSPTTLSVVGTDAPIVVTGTVDDPTVTSVTVNGFSVSASGGNFTAMVSLAEGANTITAVAQNAAGRVGTASIQIILDTTPPRLTIDSPPDTFLSNNSPINISGMINDIVVGTVNSEQAQVTVNGVPAAVANRSFLATGVTLSPGSNTITATGTDAVGNTATASITVTFRDPTGQARLTVASGNNQTGQINAALPAPLVVTLTDENGTPVAGQSVLFTISQNNGALHDGSNAGRSLRVTTDAQGQAQVTWTLGSRAGAGNNKVEATATGFAGQALFMATALPAAPDKINVDLGNNQVGAVGQPLPRPFVAVVTDAGHNRLAHVPVTFTVAEGSGTVNGQTVLTVQTDSDGRAQAALTLGLFAGFDNNRVEATFAGNPGRPATFVASGKLTGDPAATQLSGVILDNTNLPIAGVTVAVAGTALITQSDAQGQFVLAPAPVGHAQLLVDGSTAQRPGTWPHLEFELVTVAGQNNTVGQPIYLLPLDLPNGLQVSDTTGGLLTLPQVPGFSLTIAPGSATFPDGSKEGLISVTLVHSDKIPMTPNFGQQPRLVVTIQPSGVLFDPPAALSLPNVDGLAPGQMTELYSFDHDLGQFVSIGTGSVSEDGLVLRSDPGVGVIEGGWHCGGDPDRPGSGEPAKISIVDEDGDGKFDVPVGEMIEITAEGQPAPSGEPAFKWDFKEDEPRDVAEIQTFDVTGPVEGKLKSTATILGLAPGKTIIEVTYTCESGHSDTEEIEITVTEIDGAVIVTSILNPIQVPEIPEGFVRRHYALGVPVSAGESSMADSDLSGRQLLYDILFAIQPTLAGEMQPFFISIAEFFKGAERFFPTTGFRLTPQSFTPEDREYLALLFLSLSTNPEPPDTLPKDLNVDILNIRQLNALRFSYHVAEDGIFGVFTELTKNIGSKVGATPLRLPGGTLCVTPTEGGDANCLSAFTLALIGGFSTQYLADNSIASPNGTTGGKEEAFVEHPLYTRAGPTLNSFEDAFLNFRAPAFFSEIRFDIVPETGKLAFNPVLGHSPTHTWPSHFLYRWDNTDKVYELDDDKMQTSPRGPIPGFLSLGTRSSDPPAGPVASPTHKTCGQVVNQACVP